MTVPLTLRLVKGSPLTNVELDNNLTSLASMEGNLSNVTHLPVSTTLTSVDFGQLIILNAAFVAATLPLLSTTMAGDTIYFESNYAGCSVLIQGTDTITISNTPTNTVALGYGDNLTLVSDGTTWNAVYGTVLLPYSSTLIGPNWTTPAQFDNSKRLSTTQYVNSLGMKVAGNASYSANQTLNLTQLGYIVYCTGAGGFTITLPSASTVLNEMGYILSNTSTGNITVATQGGDIISSDSVTITPGGRVMLISDGGTGWHSVFHSNITSPNFALATGNTPPVGDMSTKFATMAALYSAADGLATINVAGNVDVVLTQSQYGEAILNLTGVLTGNINLILPSQSGQWIVSNNSTGSFNITAKTSIGTGAVILQGASVVIYSDGTNIHTASSTISPALSNLAIANPNETHLTNLLYPSVDGQWRDIYRAGWKPAWFNHQWGGAQWGVELNDGATDNLYKFDVSTGYIEDNSYTGVGNVSANVYLTQGFKVSETENLNAIWIKLYKIGNPSNNLQLNIVADNGSGSPLILVPITNGTATSQSGKVHTSKTDGEWYRFIFPISPTVTANTQYHIVLSSSGAVDASNYWSIKDNSTKKYPFGFLNAGTSAPVWTQYPTYAIMFLVEIVSNNQFLQTNGQFSNKLIFSDNLPINQSKALVQPLRNYFDGNAFTALHRVSNCQLGKPIADFVYGLDHDRIQIMCNSGTGYASVNFWDKNRNLVTLTSTVNVSVAALSDIAINIRMLGDGLDFLQLWINGTLAAFTSNQTYIVDKNLRELGTAWMGGGFPVAPAWTQDLEMTSLPSAQGWTWVGTATEANAMSIQNGKLFQNKNGYASTDNGYYQKTTAFNNATGWIIEWKCRISTGTNNPLNNGYGSYVEVFDGTKAVYINIQEYFLQSSGAGAGDFTFQGDFKSRENVFLLIGKGSDYYLFINGLLAIDGTGKLTVTTASNQIFFGDGSVVAGENADVIWSYIKYYQGSILPQASTGMSLHEAAYWSADHSYMLPILYNNGTPISVKKYCGVAKNYIEEVQWSEQRSGILQNPTTTGITAVLLPDMECFVLGDTFDYRFNDSVYLSGTGANIFESIVLDGANPGTGFAVNTQAVIADTPMAISRQIKTYTGLHKAEIRWWVAAYTGTSYQNIRNLTVRNSK